MVEAGCNTDKPIMRIRHAGLEQVGDQSPFRVWCPVCDQGILLVRRFDLALSRFDRCTLCGQQFWYHDSQVGGLNFAETIGSKPADPARSPMMENMIHQAKRKTRWDHLRDDQVDFFDDEDEGPRKR